MLFLHSFSSMLVPGAGRDAKRIAEHIVGQAKGRARAHGEHGAQALAKEQAAS
jgi:hypothetical protein